MCEIPLMGELDRQFRHIYKHFLWRIDKTSRDKRDDDTEDGCGRGLIKEGQVGGTIRSS